jgi:hypothetical protein
MRLVTRDELPSGTFLVKHPGHGQWFPAAVDQENPAALVINVKQTTFTNLDRTDRDAAHEGYLWNDKPETSSAKKFYVEETVDAERRANFVAAGDRDITFRLTDGRAVVGKLPGPRVPLLASGLYDEQVTIQVTVNGSPHMIHWFDVKDMTVGN